MNQNQKSSYAQTSKRRFPKKRRKNVWKIRGKLILSFAVFVALEWFIEYKMGIVNILVR